MGQSSLNASHDVFMVRTMLFDPSSYLSEVHSFVGELGHERTCRAKLALNPSCRSAGRIARSLQPITVCRRTRVRPLADSCRSSRANRRRVSGDRSRGGILALCWVPPTPECRQHAAVSHERQGTICADLRVISQKAAVRCPSLCWGFISSRERRVDMLALRGGVHIDPLKLALHCC